MCFLFRKKSIHEETKEIMKQEDLKVVKFKIERCDGLYPAVMHKAIELVEKAL